MGAWLRQTILRAASFLAPAHRRAGWLEEWRSELCYIPRRCATRFCLGAFHDALWLRRNERIPVPRTLTLLESPLSCLAFLAALGAVSAFLVVRLPILDPGHWHSHLKARVLPMGCIVMLFLSCLFLPATRFALGRGPANLPQFPWPDRLRRGLFLTLKIALVQPIVLGGFVLLIWVGPSVPFAPLGLFVFWISLLRWVLIDQRSRCPVCLGLLTAPVRIGAPSRTFLEWYGAESMCAHGHGLLQVPGFSNGMERWLCLGPSWSGLFSQAREGR
jgi:hypothetical protein